MNAEAIDRVAREMDEFSKLNFGQMSAQFPEIAKALVDSDRFTARAIVAMAAIAISAGDSLTKLSAAPSKDMPVMREALRGTITEKILVEMFYWGFEFGKQSAEIEALNRFAQGPREAGK